MSSLPSVTGKEAIAAFERNGFAVVRVSSSHHIMKKEGHPNNLSIPVHGNQTLKAGLLRGQIKAAGLTVEEFINSL
jgi:predicted RNA binding protein YcfA (HicA-like mRNA interferase family)